SARTARTSATCTRSPRRAPRIARGCCSNGRACRATARCPIRTQAARTSSGTSGGCWNGPPTARSNGCCARWGDAGAPTIGAMAGTPPNAFDGKAFARTLTTAPGVYRMYGADDALLYVGKARALRNRVGSYFNNAPRSARTQAMLAQLARMEVTVTRTEAEALLLENQLIKAHRPRYNVLLRDDKSYPYILL